ncbi:MULTISPECIES: type VII secretion-associated serine protease mycosin [unclassified Mycobacterium]|uniref:type VII secretion-associated serine protease mycosin n=1 Tax=Mycobacterium sp. UM_Kg27 TaxID=1545693 RepID=UPI001E5F5C5B|nr:MULTISPECIES: type VII secretion-associated serine protease mycosin [unclassified Mycobacterium]
MARLLAAATIAVTAAAPPASAVTPPPVDRTLVPAPAPATPERPTVQREVCAVGTLGPGAAPTQLAGLDLAAAWALTRGAGQRVAVIDTGVAPHRRLPGLIGGGDYVSTGDGTRDCDGHGTLVAGIIAAAADPVTDGFSGVAPLATVIGIRASSTRFAALGDAAGIGDVDILAKAVRTAADLGASVINISTVACRPARTGLDDRALGAALAYAVEIKNSVVVAAAGNTDQGCGAQEPMIVTPAWYDNYVLTVGSVNSRGVASAFTLPGPWVDVAAPGEAVLSLSTVGDALADTLDDSPLSGTSFAAPVVSGLAALIRSRFPQWTPHQVMDRIRATAHHPPGGRDDLVGAGVVDVLAALTFDVATSAEPPRPAPPLSRPAPDLEPAAEAAPAGLRTAIVGTAALLALLLAALTGRALSGRAPRPGSASPGHD